MEQKNVQHIQRLRHAGLLGAVVLLSACQSFDNGSSQIGKDQARIISDSQRQNRQANAQRPPADVQRALLPPMRGSASAPRSSGPRFDLSVKDLPAQDFFLSLMEESNTNIVVNPDVSGTISFSLKDVTLEQVLNAVRDSHGYDYRKTAYGYQIFSNGVLTRTFNVNALNMKREGISETSISSGQTSETTEDQGSSSGGSSEKSTTSVVNASYLRTTSEGDFWGQIKTSVGIIIGDGEGRSVVVDPQSGLLVVRAPITAMQQVERFLEDAERNLRRQVVLEAKIMEVNLSDSYQAGIDWTGIAGGNDRLTVGMDSAPITNPKELGGLFTAKFDFNNFTGLIELLQTQGDVRVLSSPRISTTNNQKAVIKVGQDEFFITKVKSDNTNSTTTGTTTQPEVVLTPFFSGIALDVTPQINENNEVTLHIKPQVSKASDQQKEFEIAGDNYSLPTALTTIRESDSIIRARSGEVVVLGGLLADASEDNDASLPGLSDLPLVGKLFQQKRHALRKTELVILLKPTVVDSSTWVKELQKSAERFKAPTNNANGMDELMEDVVTAPAP